MKYSAFVKIKKLFYKNRNKLDNKVVCYLENTIIPNYRKNDKAHGLDHLYSVLQRSFVLSKQFDETLNYNTICILAVLHDCKYHIDMENHEKLAGECLQNDRFWADYYNEHERFELKKILMEHDSKVDISQLSIYAKILRTADCEINLDVVLRRLYEFRKVYFREMSTNEIIEDSYNYMHFLYDKNGLNINKHCIFEPEFNKLIGRIHSLLVNKKQFISIFKKINHIK